jgi:signal transduction histidine kinase/CheY-like chemotaxis protein
VAGHLYDISFEQILAGSARDRRVLGRLALGREISQAAVLDSPLFGNSRFALERGGGLLLSSLQPGVKSEFEKFVRQDSTVSSRIQELSLEGERYLVASVELSGDHAVRLYALQSFDQASSFLRALNRMLLLVGAIAVLVGGAMAFLLSLQITRPLEQLAQGTRQVEKGEFEFQIPIQGADEVAELTLAFEKMRGGLRLSREALLRSARLEAVGRLAGGIAHDFNNLVMIIKGYSDLLLDCASAESRPYLEEIKRAGDRASGLTRQLLAFSRKQVLAPQILDPNQSVRNMVKMLRVLLGENIEVVTNFSEQVGRVQTDPGQLEQVIMNLAVNARDAMPNGGKLIIETQSGSLDEAYVANHPELKPGKFVVIAVTDTGYGMDKETLAHIFEPFFTTKEAGKGTGLGLATVYGIVKQSHGHVAVYSEPGLGTTFKVYLPITESAATISTEGPAASAPRGEGTVLLVEDEVALRALTAKSLRKLGYTVLEASNGLEALTVAREHPVDVLVSDVVMPQMGGPELIERLKQEHLDFAVIFMSGYTEAAALENSNIGRETVLLTKPFSNESLARKIQEVRQPRVGTHSRAAAAGSSQS